ncbi:MAG: tetratricopeptide repeat protein [Sorangiineae bacterium]|nr:tetratricopeptide repeat protein [Polyangiaceae bacterium]MEB2323786.1 tetratricopeptide repeat protein [Sorangiineae bacterium]
MTRLGAPSAVILAGALALSAGVARPAAAQGAPPAAAAPSASTPPAPSASTPAPAPGPADSAPGQPTPKPADASTAAAAGPETHGAEVAAYTRALERRKLGPSAALSRDRLAAELARIDRQLSDGRRDEAIGNLVYLVESPRFAAFERFDEGRAALYYLGDSLGRAGAYSPARGYLKRLLTGDPNDTWYRRAARSLVDFGLASDEPLVFLKDLSGLPPGAPEELRSDVAYLRGRAAERMQQPTQALAAYAEVTPRSRFWAQATYLAGLIAVERGELTKGENLFCKVADPKLTPRRAPALGGSEFFRVRDLSRLALGRVAHEQYRFDDARYYYYLVPRDSAELPEALYETATTRYEAKDYDGAREAMGELEALHRNHAYQDEAWILDAYIDLATCHFPEADQKLRTFLARYEPVRNAARRLWKDSAATTKLVESVRRGADPASAGLGVPADVARTLAALLRVDLGYGHISTRLAWLEHQQSGLRGAMVELDEAARRLATPKEVKPAGAAPLGLAPAEQVERIDSQLAEVNRLLRELEASGKAKPGDLSALRAQLAALEVEARAARAALAAAPAPRAAAGEDLSDVIRADRARATQLYAESQALAAKLSTEQVARAKDALLRLDRRLSRLLARARLGRIETVLGKKRALEIEIEALNQGLLPQSIVDSLDAERYLRDDEEYWPFDGEDWSDEYVGGEGLR